MDYNYNPYMYKHFDKIALENNRKSKLIKIKNSCIENLN